MRRILLSAALVCVVAGCGSPPVSHFSLEKTKACLTGKGARIVRPKSDIVASTASEGTFRAILHGGTNFVTLAFGADDQEALQIAQGYDRFHAKNVGVADILFRDKNVTLLWKQHPSSDDVDLVSGCLK